jgi:hypothetical protein
VSVTYEEAEESATREEDEVSAWHEAEVSREDFREEELTALALVSREYSLPGGSKLC